ncbi:Aspartate/glutamate leucyltransferase [Oligella ureolytica]
MTKSFKLHLSAPNQCSYLEARQSSSQIVVPPEDINAFYYANMLRQGFRRSGVFVYRPHCQNCQACMSLRVEVDKFVPSKRFQRIINKNKDLTYRRTAITLGRRAFSAVYALSALSSPRATRRTQNARRLQRVYFKLSG